jgi:hypothetical protein
MPTSDLRHQDGRELRRPHEVDGLEEVCRRCCAQSEGVELMDPMAKFIHEQNLALFKRRLAEAHTDADRELLIKLLADEQAKSNFSGPSN